MNTHHDMDNENTLINPPAAAAVPANPAPLAPALPRKPRCDAKLKNLPPEIQHQIIAWFQDGPELMVAKRILTRWGISTSQSALSRFRAWYCATHPQDDIDHLVEKVCGAMARLPEKNNDSDRLFDFLQWTMGIKALQDHDMDYFCKLAQLRLKSRKLDLEAERIEAQILCQSPKPLK